MTKGKLFHDLDTTRLFPRDPRIISMHGASRIRLGALVARHPCVFPEKSSGSSFASSIPQLDLNCFSFGSHLGFVFFCCKRNVSLQPTTNTIPLLHWRVTKCLWLQKVKRKWRKWLSSSFPQSHYKMQWNWNETEKESYKGAITREVFFFKDFLKLHCDWNWMFGYVVGIILNVFF